jgi:hypothetical protein
MYPDGPPTIILSILATMDALEIAGWIEQSKRKVLDKHLIDFQESSWRPRFIISPWLI